MTDALEPTEVGPTKVSRIGSITALVVTCALLTGVLVYQGHHAIIAFDRDDTNHLETPLLLATARQLSDGPSSLYGPFSGSDPLVLIHAPLYYRISALIAWPVAKLGAHHELAAMIGARGLAFAGFLLTIVAAAWIAKGAGASRLASLWAALLVAGSPVFGSFGFTVRPDTLAIGLQTLAFACIWTALGTDRESSPWPRMIAGGVLFGLAACAKQHMIVAWGVTVAIVVISVLVGRVRKTVSIVSLVVVPCSVVVAYYGWEQWVTGGEMAKSVFLLPSRLRQTSPASWSHVAVVFYEVAKLAVGSILLTITILFARASSWRGSRLDASLWFLLIAETAAMIPLCLGSQGAWVNYAMPSAVWGAILIARALDRALSDSKPKLAILLLIPASLLAMAADARLAAISYTLRRDDVALMRQVLADPIVVAIAPEKRYFVGLPQGNRLYGRMSIAHDEWLYSSYEALKMAEPRTDWLKRELITSVWLVIIPTDDRTGRADYVYGLPWPIDRLGYRIHQQYGRYAVWIRDSPATSPDRL